MVKRPQRRIAVEALKKKGLSTRKSCSLSGITPSGYRYEPKESDLNMKLRRKMKNILATHKTWGLPTLFDYLRTLGYKVNRKRVHRLYKESSLQIRRRKRRQKLVRERIQSIRPERPNQRWSVDFIFDTTVEIEKLKCLVVVDDFTRECLAIEPDKSIPGWRVGQVLDSAIQIYGKPDAIISDNGPEFISKDFTIWALKRSIKLEYIEPGKPNQNAFVEAFNSIFRNQCLNENWFLTLTDASRIIEEWRKVYNQIRPHGSLKGNTPEKFRKLYYGKPLTRDEEVFGV